MSTHLLHPPDPVTSALEWIAARGIDVRPWPPPPEADRREPRSRWVAEVRAVLYVVAPDAQPPRCGALEDWIRAPLERDELFARADVLLARVRSLGPVHVGIDADGVVWVDDQLAILSPTEARLMEQLVGHLDQIVPRGDLVRLLWPDADAGAKLLAKHVASLRRKLAHLPLEIHAVRSQGLLLERVAS